MENQGLTRKGATSPELFGSAEKRPDRW